MPGRCCRRSSVEPADPAADRRALSELADWCGRYTPWTAVDREASHPGEFGGGAGLWLDVSGCAHLFGGEEALLRDLLARLEGLASRRARRSPRAPAPPGQSPASPARRSPWCREGAAATALAPLPVRGLRLPPEVAAALQRMGLRRIGDLLSLPRAPLTARFGDILLRRLDQALGSLDEPLSPRLPPPACSARASLLPSRSVGQRTSPPPSIIY